MEASIVMSSSRAPGTTRSGARIAALSLMLLAVAFGVTIASLRAIEIAIGRPHPPGDYWVFNTLVAIVFSVCGAAIAVRRPENPIGWAFIAGALGNGIAGIGGEYTVLTGDPIGAWLLTWAWMPLPLAIAVTLHTFPTGRAPAPRWRSVLIAAILAGVAGIIVQATSSPMAVAPPSSEGPPLAIRWPAWVTAASLLVYPAAMVTGIASLAMRFRSSRGDERAQIKWLLVACVPLLILSIVGVGGVIASAISLLLIAIPVATATLRYRLYDIDLVINRALVYGLLGLLVAAAYLVLATAIGRLAGGEGSPVTATVATVLAALVALAARQAVQQAIGRLLYGRRGDPLTVIGSVARRLESAGTPEGLLTDVVGDLREALKLDAVAVYAVDGVLLAGTARPEEGSRLPLSHQGEPVGELRVWTARGDALKPGDLRLLGDDLGPQLAVAIEAVRLKRDLQRARERLVAALEGERRRLRHDLHDGLGPTLTAITLRADAATNLLAKDPDRARELLAELRAAAGEAIAEIRRLTHGLRPAALDELGLVGAIREQGIGVDRAGMEGPEIVLDDVPELPPLPAAVEVAAYRIATEAITNAIRHSDATRCRVRITADRALEVEVTDNGHGWSGRLTPGVGIQSMRERAADLGGTLTIEAAPGGGTSVRARLPLTMDSAA
jgi:signal transduction histidine kinase